MFLSVVFATCVFLYVGLADEVTTNNTLSPRILGGIPFDWAQMHLSFPVQIKQIPSDRYIKLHGLKERPELFFTDTDTFPMCLGSLIDPRWILTLARCLQIKNDNRIGFVFSDTREEPVIYEWHDAVKAVFLHPDFNGYDNDIGLLHIKRSSKVVRPINIGNIKGDLKTPLLFLGLGSAFLENTEILGNELYFFPMMSRGLVVSTTPCRPGLLDRSEFMESILCTSTTNGHGACTGDDGGPLYHVEDDNTFTLFGILARYVPCATGEPDTFINVSYYSKWIVDTVRKHYMG